MVGVNVCMGLVDIQRHEIYLAGRDSNEHYIYNPTPEISDRLFLAFRASTWSRESVMKADIGNEDKGQLDQRHGSSLLRYC